MNISGKPLLLELKRRELKLKEKQTKQTQSTKTTKKPTEHWVLSAPQFFNSVWAATSLTYFQIKKWIYARLMISVQCLESRYTCHHWHQNQKLILEERGERQILLQRVLFKNLYRTFVQDKYLFIVLSMQILSRPTEINRITWHIQN